MGAGRRGSGVPQLSSASSNKSLECLHHRYPPAVIPAPTLATTMAPQDNSSAISATRTPTRATLKMKPAKKTKKTEKKTS